MVNSNVCKPHKTQSRSSCFVRPGVWLSAFCLPVIFFLASCSQPTVDSVKPAETGAKPNVIQDIRIFTDAKLGKSIQVVLVTESKVADRLKVQVELRNPTGKRARIKYRFDWLDGQGTLIRNPNVTWRSVILQGGETQWISSVARSAQAADFHLKLLRAAL